MYTKNIGSFENVFSHGFLKYKKKIIFLHFWILQHVYNTPKGIGQYSKKIWQKKYKNMFLRVAYGQYPNMFLTFFFFIQKILEVSKMCFRMDFLNTKKNLFSCISRFYNMFVKLQRVLAKIPKNIKSYFRGNSSIIHR